MPGFDGLGPQGDGPMTGRGEGHCAVAQPRSGKPYGLAGIQGRPVRGGFFGRLARVFGPRGLGRGRRAGRGRGVGRGGRW